MRLKRGAGIQFNWAFVLIIGVVLLIFFIGTVQRQKSSFETSTGVLILNSLDSILSSSGISIGTINLVEMPKAKIEFECGKAAINGVSKQLNGMNIFAPKVLEDGNMVTMTVDWSIPYRVSDFVYLTTPKVRYIFIGDSSFARNIFDMIPDEINNDGYTNVNAIEDENDDNIRLIFFGTYPKIPESLKEMENGITALKIDNDGDKGKVEFFDLVFGKFESRGTSYYLDKNMLLGAVFTDKIENYDCAVKNSFKDLNAVSQLYEKKTNNLKLYYETEQCAQYYDSSLITEIKEASSKFSQSSIDKIDKAAKNLENQNKNLQEQSCILVY